MTNEEKAKAYDKGIETVKKLMDTMPETDYLFSHVTKDDVRNMFAMVYPELKESEDEKIRKFIYDYIADSYWMKDWNVSQEECLAYLERQKPTATINGEPIPTENQSVDIPLTKWTNEDERIANALILELKTNPSVAMTNGYKRGDYIDWLNDLLAKPRRECSKNDKKVLESAIYWLRKRLKDENAHDIVTVESPMSVKETVERLESLQPQEGSYGTMRQ